MTDAPSDTQTSGSPLNPDDPEKRRKLERTLTFVVAFLGFLIVAGLVAVVSRVIYLSSHGGTQGGEATLTKTVAAPLHPAAGAPAPGDAVNGGAGHAIVPFALPKGAEIKTIALDGTRVAIQYSSSEGAGILIVEQATGETVAHLRRAP